MSSVGCSPEDDDEDEPDSIHEGVADAIALDFATESTVRAAFDRDGTEP